MSTSEILQQLETCAQILMAPPNNISATDRTKAEEVFLNFQKTKAPFKLCREMMEITQNQFVLFQIGACLKCAIIREWSLLGVEQSSALFNYLFDFVNRRPLDQYVVEEMMLVNAIILKRIDIEELSKDQSETSKTMIASLFIIIKNPAASVQMRINACTAIIRILSEYSTLSYNSDYGLSWYSHLNAKRSFEKRNLKDIFSGAIEVLYGQIKMPEEIRRSNDNIKLSAKLIRICEMVLTWNMESFSFITGYFIKARDRIESQMFNPPNDWFKFIIDGNLISFFFEMYLSFRSIDPNLLHSSLTCLTQLSTMVCIRHEMSLRVKFSETFMQNTISLCNMIMDVISLHEVQFLSNMFNSICIYLRSHVVIDECNPTLTKQFIDTMIKFTCKVLLESVKIKTRFDEDDFDKCNQSIEYLMNSVMIIVKLTHYDRRMHEEVHGPSLNQNEQITLQELCLWTKPLFETYLRVHLSEPEGLLPLACFKDDDEIQEFEEDDIGKFREQMIAIGSIGQVDLRSTIDTITQLMIMKLQQFEACITAMNMKAEDKMLQWMRISEDIHWILMISTYIFTSYAENDIPTEVVDLSIKASADIQATMAALQNGDFTRPNIDPVVRYFIVILKLVQMEKQLLENNMIQWVSPQVSYTLTYFVSRFLHIYLVPPEYESDQSVMSLSLNSCFGADSPNVKNLINFFLDHMETKFLTMSSETQVLELSSEGLRVFCEFRDRIKLLHECASLHRLLQRFPIDPNFRKLNSAVRRDMYNVFIIVFAQNQDVVIDPLINLYQTFREHLRAGQRELIQEEFLIIVDFTMGISSGTTSNTFNHVWRKFLLPFYNELPEVLRVMHKCSIVVQAILELLFHLSTCFSIYFKEEDSLAFYKTAVAIFTEYALHTKDTFSLDATRLEEMQAEFISILKFLNDLSNQDIFLFFTNPSLTSSLNQTIGQVVITSLNIIMPLMNDQLLENQRLCALYYKLLEFISQDTDRFKGFPIKLFESYLKCVEYAFRANNIPNEIKAIGFKILVQLGYQTAESSEPSEEILKFLRPFFQIIIEFIFCELVRNNDLILRDAVAMALYSLVRCFRQSYQDIIRELMRFINDPPIEDRICRTLFSIVEEVGLNSRYNAARLTFKKRFSEFINQLHSMLTLR
ncbi:exportin-4-like [Dermatophagoides pteronyssinus]|uniref:exportin-4-like n=1 Tax=Dermatophagoides pteronyssinus TaxID=6956 RepID=UPI003F67BF16